MAKSKKSQSFINSDAAKLALLAFLASVLVTMFAITIVQNTSSNQTVIGDVSTESNGEPTDEQ